MRGAISGSNKHQVYVEMQQRSDVEQLEEMIADAARAARDAIDVMPMLDYRTFKPVQREVQYLEGTIEKRRILSQDFRQHIGLILHSLGKTGPGASDPDMLTRLVDKLEAARRLSHRVEDLLNAEQEINRKRSHRG